MRPGGDGAGGLRSALNLYSPLSRILRGEPATVPLQASVRDALEIMERRRTRFVVVADPATRVPLGIFTLRDLVGRVALPGVSLEEPVALAMTSGLLVLEPQASAHQAALAMARSGVRHVVVADGAGRLVGVVSQEDVFGLQRVGVREVNDRIQAATGLAGLQEASRAIRGLAGDLVAQGTSAETVTHFLTALHDLLTIRAIELASDEHELPPVPMCWLALGSAGRLEQSVASDQDNAILFDVEEDDAPAVRLMLLPFAQAVNRTLHACGIPLCAGNVMAGSGDWCLTLAGWKRTFSRWIQDPTPEAVRLATVFFDFRAVHGSAALAERLREWLLREVSGRTVFLRQMAESALAFRPPLGTLRAFAYDRSRTFPHTLDLKMAGSVLFADAARILALARSIPHTSTAQRLREVAETGLFAPGTLAGMIDGFHFIHLLRLRNQCRPGLAPGGGNRVDPRRLNDLDRHVLRESFRQARRLQETVVMEYGLRT